MKTDKWTCNSGHCAAYRRDTNHRLWLTLRIDTNRTSRENFTSTTSASTATSAAKPPRIISPATMTADIPTSTSSPDRRKKKRAARKPWKAARSKPSATTAARPANLIFQDPRAETLAGFLLGQRDSPSPLNGVRGGKVLVH